MRSITAEDRRLIDEAIAHGKVRRIPRGVSGLPEVVYNPETGQLVSSLSWRDGQAKSFELGRKRAESRQKRHEAIKALWAEGKSPREIHQSINISKKTFDEDLRALRAAGVNIPTQFQWTRAKNREQVMALLKRGLGQNAISRKTGLARETVAGFIAEVRK